MRHRAALVAGSLALALASLVPAGAGQGDPAADGWRTFEAAWSAAGRRQAVAIEGGAAARIYEFSGALVIKKGEGLGRGFEAEAIAFDDGEVFGWECVAHQLGDDGGGVRRELGRFEHNAVARGQRADQWREQKLKGIVPGADDQSDTQGLRYDVARCGKVHERCAHTLRLNP
jgi:hypothetical protein